MKAPTLTIVKSIMHHVIYVEEDSSLTGLLLHPNVCRRKQEQQN